MKTRKWEVTRMKTESSGVAVKTVQDSSSRRPGTRSSLNLMPSAMDLQNRKCPRVVQATKGKDPEEPARFEASGTTNFASRGDGDPIETRYTSWRARLDITSIQASTGRAYTFCHCGLFEPPSVDGIVTVRRASHNPGDAVLGVDVTAGRSI
jgi:hypothetical protein